MPARTYRNSRSMTSVRKPEIQAKLKKIRSLMKSKVGTTSKKKYGLKVGTTSKARYK